jgi:hypothetical protein
MMHAPSFWAAKLPKDRQPLFWALVTEWGFTGETAYCRVIDKVYG